MIRHREQIKEKSFSEMLISDTSFPEKLVVIMWCAMPYLIWMMSEGLEIWYRVLTSIGVWILLTLLCYWFGKFMSNPDRDWNY
tara:strand:- start:542 stop:790 length:249 start_codon:yes stop_codon:yes gene_type:complete